MAGRTPGRIVLPKKVSELLVLGEKIYEKHLADGAASPLNAQQDFSWSVEGPKVAPCKGNHEKAEAAAKLAEELYKERDKDYSAVVAIIQNSAQLLKTIYAKNPKVLGQYGFVVDDSPKPKK